MLSILFDPQSIVHYEFTPQGQTVNQDYMEVLRCLQDALQRKRPEMWTMGMWQLHHNNAPAHTALSIREFLVKHPIPVLPQPHYLYDLSPPNFFVP
jgi:hypothetical protein